MAESYILFVEDDWRFVAASRNNLSAMLPGLPVEHAVTLHEAAAKIAALGTPQIAIVDLHLPDGSGLDLITDLGAADEGRILVITAVEDPLVAIEAIRAGADGYLIKQGGPIDIAEAVEIVVSGGSPITPSVARHVLQNFRNAAEAHEGHAAPPSLPALSERENEVLAMLTLGFRDKEIALKLGISPFTVATHVRHIYKKMSISSRTELRRKLSPFP